MAVDIHEKASGEAGEICVNPHLKLRRTYTVYNIFTQKHKNILFQMKLQSIDLVIGTSVLDLFVPAL